MIIGQELEYTLWSTEI